MNTQPATKLTTYDVTAWKEFTHYAVISIQASTPAEAIEKARQGWEDGDADWEACDDGGNPVHYALAEPNIDSNGEGFDESDPKHHADWTDPKFMDERCADAARAMLAALQTAVCALPYNQDNPITAKVRAAIAQAEAAGITTA